MNSIKERTMIVYGLGNQYKPELWKSIKNRSFINTKPRPGTGLWASPEDSEYGWVDWCESEDFRVDRLDTSFKFKLKPDSRVLVINSYRDLITKLRDYWIKPENDFGGLFECGIDFEKLCLDYDAMFLTDRGQSRTRSTFPYNLYGWDCESILILNNNIIIPV